MLGLEATREEFEDAVYLEYFIKNVYRDKSTLGFSVKVEDKATFLRRDAEDEYVREDVSAMWFGWKLYHKSVSGE